MGGGNDVTEPSHLISSTAQVLVTRDKVFLLTQNIRRAQRNLIFSLEISHISKHMWAKFGNGNSEGIDGVSRCLRLQCQPSPVFRRPRFGRWGGTFTQLT
jgi:hypothetical protein